MRAEDWINPSYPCLSIRDTVADALSKLQLSVGCTELALKCEDGSFGGFFVASDLADKLSKDSLAAAYCSRQEAKVLVDAPHYEVLRVSQQHRGSAIAVVDATKKYMGSIAPRDMIAGMSFFSAIRSPGSVIKLELRQEDYTLSEIARLVEENRSKILSLSVIQDPKDAHLLSVSMKLSSQDSNAVQKTLSRYGYQVSAQSGGSDALSQTEQSNYEHLMKYLSV